MGVDKVVGSEMNIKEKNSSLIFLGLISILFGAMVVLTVIYEGIDNLIFHEMPLFFIKYSIVIILFTGIVYFTTSGICLLNFGIHGFSFENIRSDRSIKAKFGLFSIVLCMPFLLVLINVAIFVSNSILLKIFVLAFIVYLVWEFFEKVKLLINENKGANPDQ